MNLPRFAGVGVLIAAVALLAAGCGGVKNPEGWAGPAVEGSSSVYYFPAKNRLVGATLSVDGTQGTRTWQFPDKTKPEQKDVSFSAVYGVALDTETDRLFFGSWDQHFYAVRTDGTLLWSIKTAGGLVGAPSLAGDNVVFATTDGRLYAFKKDGTPATGWAANGKSVARAIWAPTVTSADGKTVYIATMDGEVKAFDVASGNPASGFTTFKVDGAIAELALLDSGHLFVPSLNKHVYIVETGTGKAVAPEGFATDDWVWTKPAFKDNVAYFGDFAGKVYALDIRNPTTASWVVDGKAKVKAGPVIIDDVLIVGTRDPAVLFIDLKATSDDTRLKNTVPVPDGGTFRAPLTVENGYGLIATTNGKLYRADPKNFSVVQLTVAGEK